jgi:hypothetical protein
VRVSRRRALLVATGAAALVAVAAVGVAWILDSDTSTAPATERSSQGSLERCVSLWNDPANSKQRAILNAAALAGAARSPPTPGGVPVARRVLVLRYAGPPLEDVGIGEPGVNASRGDCLVAHPSQALFLYTRGAWHRVGYSPGLAFEGVPERATSSPNAVMAIRSRTAPRDRQAGRIELLRTPV